MSREGREQNFERSLARHLRAEKPASSGAARCADAEILAAYHERELPPQELTFWREHISSCSRCQEILAHVQGTDAIQLEAAALANDDALASAGPKAALLQIAKPRRTRLWLWAVPAGAIAAALLVWVTSQQKIKPMEMAKNEPPVSVSTAAVRSEAASTAEKAVADAVRENSLARERSPLLNSKQSAEPKALRMQAPASPPPARKDQRDDGKFDAFSSATAAQAQPVQGAVSDELDKLKKTAPAVPPSAPLQMSESVTVNEEAPAIPQSPLPSAAHRVAKAKAATSPGSQSPRKEELQQMQSMSRLSDAGLKLVANGQSAVIVPTPNKKVSWRVGAAGSIERSEDAGATWSLQTSGTVTDLLAGSGPSDSVCWVVGQLGTILRTTDAGATWTKLPSPVAEDIRAVFAASTQQATVSTARASYQTSDAGATWTKLAPE